MNSCKLYCEFLEILIISFQTVTCFTLTYNTEVERNTVTLHIAINKFSLPGLRTVAKNCKWSSPGSFPFHSSINSFTVLIMPM